MKIPHIKLMHSSIRSQGHVEMILSFAIFVGFVFAMFFFLNPTKDNVESYAILDAAENIVLDNVSTNYRYIALILEQPRQDTTCFGIDNPFNFSEGLLAIDETNNVVNSLNKIMPSPQKIYLKPNTAGLRLYKLYFSDDFADYPVANYDSCNNLDSKNYTFGVLTAEKSIMFEKLAVLQKRYIENYKQLKSDLKVNEDFEFVVYNLNRNQTLFDTTGFHKLKSSLVLSQDFPLRMIDMNGTQYDIIINFRVW